MEASPALIILTFAAGALSFLCPAGLALLTCYLPVVSGLFLTPLKGGEQSGSLRRSVISGSILFIIGFSFFFTITATAAATGTAVLTPTPILRGFAGLVVLVFALRLLDVLKFNGPGIGALVMLLLGAAFALSWAPDIGPILSVILLTVEDPATITRGLLFLTVYSLGFAVPFFLTSLGLHRLLSFAGWSSKRVRVLQVLSGAVVLCVGLLILTGEMWRMSSYFEFLGPIEDSVYDAVLRVMQG